jgi:hypothetical protein
MKVRDDHGTLSTAYNTGTLDPKLLCYTSKRHGSYSGWMECHSEQPFEGVWTPSLEFGFNYKGAGYSPLVCKVSRRFGGDQRFGVLPNFPVAYVGHDWRFRFVQIEPVKAYSIISDALGTLTVEDCALPNVSLNLVSSSNIPKSWHNALEHERAAAAAVSSN